MNKKIILCLGLIAVLFLGCIMLPTGTNATEPKEPIVKPMERGELTTWTYTTTPPPPQTFPDYTDDATYSYIATSGGFDRITKWNATKYHKSVGSNPTSITNCSNYIYYVWGTGQVGRCSKTNFATNSYNIGGANQFRFIRCDGIYLWAMETGPMANKIWRTSLTGTGATSYNLPNSNMTSNYYWMSQDSTYIYYDYSDNGPMPSLQVLGKMDKGTGVFTEYVLPYLDGMCNQFYVDYDYIVMPFIQDNFTYSMPFFGLLSKSTWTWDYNHYIPDFVYYGESYDVRLWNAIKCNNYIYFNGGNAAISPHYNVIYYYNLDDNTNGTFIDIHQGDTVGHIFKDYNDNYAWFPIANFTDMTTQNIAKVGIMFDTYGTIESPDSSNEYYGGDTHNIDFTIINGSAPYKVRFNYSLDAMGTGPYYSLPGISQPVTYATAGAKTQSFTVPSGINNDTFRIRAEIWGEDFDYYVAESEPFIVSMYPSLTYQGFPYVGDNLLINSTFQVNYTISNGLPNYTVFVNYSLYLNGSTPTYNIINQTWTSTGLKCFNWTTPVLTENTICYLTLEILDRNNKYNYSNTNPYVLSMPTGSPEPPAPVAPIVTITYPELGTEFNAGDYGNINYTISNGSGIYFIWLNYSIDGANYSNIDTIIQFGEDDYTYNWTIPNQDSTTVTINITVIDGNDLTDSDTSPEFTINPLPIIIPPSLEITITYPELATEYTALGTGLINYTIANGSGFYVVWLNYSTDNGGNYSNIDIVYLIGEDDYTYSWTVPNEPSTQSKVRLTVMDGNIATDSATSPLFIINPPALVVAITNPETNDNYTMGDTINITWGIDGGLAPFNYSLFVGYDGDNWTQLTDNESNTGYYNWDTPIIDSDDYQPDNWHIIINVLDFWGLNATDTTGNFSIWEGEGPIIPPIVPPTQHEITIIVTVDDNATEQKDIPIIARVSCADGIDYAYTYYYFSDVELTNAEINDLSIDDYDLILMVLSLGDGTDGYYTTNITGQDIGFVYLHVVAVSNASLGAQSEEYVVEITAKAVNPLNWLTQDSLWLIISGLVIVGIGWFVHTNRRKNRAMMLIGLIIMIIGICISLYGLYLLLLWLGII